jgi:general stress protein YciG
MAGEKKGGMSVREAGRKGGQKVRDTRGPEFYKDIGKKGGETIRDTRGHEFYEEIGHKGGQKVRELIEAGKSSLGASAEPDQDARSDRPAGLEEESDADERR